MPSDLANLYLVYYTQYSSQGNDGAHVAQGKEDGQKNMPDTDAAEFGFYEQGIVNQAKGAVQQFRSAVDQEVQSLESQHRTKKGELDAETATRNQSLTQDQQAEVQLINQSSGKSSPRFQLLEGTRAQSKAALDRIRIDIDGRPLHTHFASFYLPLLGVLTILEVPINQQAFAFFFEHQPAIAYVIALAVGMFFVFFAHMTGWMIRTTGKSPGQNSPPKPYMVVAALVLFVLVCMYFLASVRATYFEFLTSSTSDEAILGQLGLLEVASKAASEWTAVFASPDALTFLLLNIAIFLVGAFLAFFRHDPHRDYEKVKKEHEDAVAKISIMLDAYNKRSIEIIEKYRSKMNTLNATLKNKADEVDDLKNRVDSLKKSFNNDKELVEGVVAQEVSAYQRANNSARTTDDPKYFGAAYAQGYISNALSTNL